MSDGCVTYPGRPYIAPIPPSTNAVPDLAWDSGALSVDTVSGNASLVFNMSQAVTGAIVGVQNPIGTTGSIGNPTLVQFAFMFQQANGFNLYGVVENGIQAIKGVIRDSGLDESFEVRRVGYKVTYLVNGTTIYTSRINSFGDLVATGCLFAPLDAIG